MRFMKLDIPYYIRQVLRESREVHLDSIGSFVVRQQSAKINVSKSAINPPTLELDFEANGNYDTKLEQYIADYDGITMGVAKKEILKYSELAFNKLLNFGTFEIEGLGVLTKNKFTDVVKFIPAIPFFTEEYEGLGTLPITPISRVKLEPENVAHAIDSSNLPSEDKSLLPWWIPILAGCIVGLFYIMSIKGCFDRKPDTSNNGILESKIVLDSTVNKQDKVLDSVFSEVDHIIEPTKTETEPVNTTKTKKIDDSQVIVKDKPTKKGEFDEYLAIIPQSGKCKIVVGSFKKPTNITRMISRLERKGYKSYTHQHNGLTRVGLIFNCTNTDLKSYIQKVRKEIIRTAWYLDPQLRVEYK